MENQQNHISESEEIDQNDNFGVEMENWVKKRAKKILPKRSLGNYTNIDHKCSFNMQNWQHPKSGL